MPRSATTEKRVATAVRLPEPLHDELQHQADIRDVSVNFLVVKAVTRYLADLTDPEGAPAEHTRPQGSANV